MRISYILILFTTSCLFIDTGHSGLILSREMKSAKIFLSFFLPLIISVVLYLFEKDFIFQGKCTAVIMIIKVIICFCDTSLYRFFPLLGESDNLFYFVYGYSSMGAVFVVSLVITHINKNKENLHFQSFFDDYMLGLTFFAGFSFIMAFFLTRQVNSFDVVVNFKPFHGEIGNFINNLRFHQMKSNFFIHTAGNVLFFALMELITHRYIKRKDYFFNLMIPILVSVSIESWQLISKSGDADVDDIILNSTGAVLGLIFYICFLKKLLSEEEK